MSRLLIKWYTGKDGLSAGSISALSCSFEFMWWWLLIAANVAHIMADKNYLSVNFEFVRKKIKLTGKNYYRVQI